VGGPFWQGVILTGQHSGGQVGSDSSLLGDDCVAVRQRSRLQQQRLWVDD